MVEPFYVPSSSVWESPSFFASLPTLGIVCLSYFSYVSGCAELFRFGFNLCFPNDQGWWLFMCLLITICISSLCLFKYFCPFFKKIFSSFILFYFRPCHAACGILVPWAGITPRPPAVKARSLNHWTAREFPCPFLKPSCFYYWKSFKSSLYNLNISPLSDIYFANIFSQCFSILLPILFLFFSFLTFFWIFPPFFLLVPPLVSFFF